MATLDMAALLLSMAAVFSYINHRFIRLQTTIGIMLIAIVMSGTLVLLGHIGLASVSDRAATILRGIDFNRALMHGMLSFLLFAGALHVNLEDLSQRKWTIGILATAGLLIAALVMATLSWLVFGLLDVNLPFIYCLLFGALIAPTDPVAVMGILKKVGVGKSLETKITGESLFNDGVAVVVFLVLLEFVTGHHEITVGHIVRLFVEEAIGGILYGLVIGFVVYLMLRTVDNYQVEVLLTLALVMGGYALARAIHVSGPLAMVVAGLLIGNRGRVLGMSAKTREHIDSFWELVDEVLNAVLFLLIGLEMLVLTIRVPYVLAGLIMIPAVLFARWVSVSIPITLLRPFREFSPKVIRILTWGGLRGGISVALALSLPAGREREVLLSVTYIIVVFSILVQGMTLERLVASKNNGESHGP